MAQHPYKDAPAYAFWRRSVADMPLHEVDPVIRAEFAISKTDRVATAGSCFAQNISRHLRQHGFNYYVAERAHPIASTQIAHQYNYGTFSARYGNIYTARQLVQLLKRAYDEFRPEEDIWETEDGRFIDPFRPQIQPDGFSTRTEYDTDRVSHFAKVRDLIEQLDVLVFTLGLTECWRSRADGAVFPLCPGVAGGTFDPARHEFINFGVDEIAGDLLELIDWICKRNTKAKIILTVSPVPLIATAENRHVLVSTAYSKSVLRVAAEMVSTARPAVAYFPSYEIVAGSFNKGQYFAGDLRSVTEEGVSHVMRLFLKHYMGATDSVSATIAPGPEQQRVSNTETAEMAALVELNCDEEALDRPTNARR